MGGRAEPGKLQLRPGDVEPTVDQLLRTPLFANASDAVVRRLGSLTRKGAVALRRYRAGEIVCEQGEAGWTAFYILRDADIRRLGVPSLAEDESDEAPLAHRGSSVLSAPSVTIEQLLLSQRAGSRVKAQLTITPAAAARAGSNPDLLGRVRKLFVSKKRRAKAIPVDASAEAAQTDGGTLAGRLREGELFGEMSCFNHTPRAATVRAIEDCYMLELMRSVLEDALDNQDFRRALDQVYRKRVLETHLAAMPIFEHASPEALDALRRGAELITFSPGATIFREGDPADAMYYVRLGTVKLFRGGPEGRVVGYRSRGEWIGGGSLLAGEPRRMTAVAHEVRPRGTERPSKSTVAGRVEVVRIGGKLFDEVCAMFPELRDTARRFVDQRTLHSLQPTTSTAVETLAGSLGLSHAEKLMLIDLDRCTRCDDCVRACADTHGGVPLMERDGPRFGSYLIPGSCRQCLDPVCLLGCPVGSIHRGDDGEIVIEDWCIGCGLCAEQCPYEAIKLDGAGAIKIDGAAARKAHVCDQCASIGGTPMCVHACPHDAAHRVDGRSFFADWARRS
jgi:CRP-like cAMP-binding protein/Fe-S-cluster-containing hydrogenase component 2